MSIARRTLLTTTAAGTLLCALWFVPSANATDEADTPSASAGSSAGSSVAARQASATGEFISGDELADTGAGVDTTPYLVGGMASLCVGAGFVVYSVRRGTTPNTGF
uniref:LPXTG cell wall anchor domain-containing protein n=1 Tax=Streptomyces sp. NBC_01401 TaxID=2903854 RepID=A0AAU3GVP8_9ACTN